MKFKVGDKVKLCPSSPYYGNSSQIQNFGTICIINNGDEHLYSVEFTEDGRLNSNSYRECDLLIYKDVKLIYDDAGYVVGEEE